MGDRLFILKGGQLIWTDRQVGGCSWLAISTPLRRAASGRSGCVGGVLLIVRPPWLAALQSMEPVAGAAWLASQLQPFRSWSNHSFVLQGAALFAHWKADRQSIKKLLWLELFDSCCC